ncbi:MAG TPA: polyprenyl synthetase family protein [Candidatus Babeliales bacterium]|nr:polyprenyl synthetase family protein [Candidatus Babeliales bacterium]
MDLEEVSRIFSISDLPKFISGVEREFLKARTNDKLLKQAVTRAFNLGGRRLRPILLFGVSTTCDVYQKRLLIKGGAAIELVHQASLIHDDIIDKSRLRRGEPTMAAAEGQDTALLAGDYMIASGLGLAAKVGPQVVDILSQAIERMCEGQFRELDIPRIKALDDKYIDIARSKSAALISAACKIGGIIRDFSGSDTAALGRFGENFGIAFQIIDDVIDDDFRPNDIKAALDAAKKYVQLAEMNLAGTSTKVNTVGLADFISQYSNYSLSLKKP